MSWNPPNPYTEFDDDDYTAGFHGWAERVGYLLENTITSISINQDPA